MLMLRALMQMHVCLRLCMNRARFGKLRYWHGEVPGGIVASRSLHELSCWQVVKQPLMLQDKIEELQASLDAAGAEAKALSEQNTATEQELQASRLLWHCCQQQAPSCVLALLVRNTAAHCVLVIIKMLLQLLQTF